MGTGPYPGLASGTSWTDGGSFSTSASLLWAPGPTRHTPGSRRGGGGLWGGVPGEGCLGVFYMFYLALVSSLICSGFTIYFYGFCREAFCVNQ